MCLQETPSPFLSGLFYNGQMVLHINGNGKYEVSHYGISPLSECG